MPLFCVVEFIGETHDGQSVVDIIPTCWMTEEQNECFWPSGRNVTKAVKDRQKPEESWPKYSIRVLGWAGTFEAARKKCKKAEATSDLQTDGDDLPARRKRRAPKPLLASSEEETDIEGDVLPPTPPEAFVSKKIGLSMSLLGGSPTQSPGHRAAQLLRGQSLAPQKIDGAMFITLVTLLEEVKDTLKLHGQMLNTLLKKDSMPVMAIPDGAVFPLANVEDVIAMNEKLSDPEFMSAVVAMVADIGGSSLEDATRRMMKFLMVPELQRQYNVTGRMGKLCFKDLRLFEVFYGALKSNAVTQNVNRKDVEMALGKWFTGARDRGGERAARALREKTSTTQTP
ncbi:hypothetical protein PO909_029985 [Leuciscus waleckii]